MKLILHIGTEKTGTTSIQKFLKKNRQSLVESKIYFPLSVDCGSGNHRWISAMAYSQDFVDDFITTQKFKDKKDREVELAKRKRQFFSECQYAVHSCNTFILSSEHFHSRLQREDDVGRLHKLLRDVFEEIQIVVYIRDPLKAAVSRFSSEIKWGGRVFRFLPGPTEADNENLCDHAQTLKLWRKCFPDAKILVRRFDKDLLVGGDVVIDFCSKLLPEFDISDYESGELSNESLSLTGMALLRKINLQLPMFIDGKPNNTRNQIVQYISNNTRDGTKFLPCKEEFQVFKEHFEESNEFVRSRWFPGEKSLFTSEENLASERIDLDKVEIDCNLCEQLIAFSKSKQ